MPTAFGPWSASFYEVWFRFHPERAIEAGVSGFEGRLPAFDDDDVGALTSWLETPSSSSRSSTTPA